MIYYTSTRGAVCSPVRKYFKSINELNRFYGKNTDEDDYDKGYSFEYEGKTYFLYSENSLNR